MNKEKLGIQGELFVVNHLQKQGFTICVQNYRKFFGEVDIIACKKNLYIFVEVKTRKSNNIALQELVSFPKQIKIIKTAQHFIAENQINNAIIRFDVALLLQSNTTFLINYIENAFTQPESYYGY